MRSPKCSSKKESSASRHRWIGSFERLERRSLLTLVVHNVTTTEGTALTNIDVASFDSSDVSGTMASSLSATVDWGNHALTTGLIVPDGTGFDILGSNTYYSPSISQPYPITVTLSVSGSPVETAKGSAFVGFAALNSTGMNVSATKGEQFSGLVAAFNDANTMPTSTSYSATINWGDGTAPTSGQISPSGSGAFTVLGNHIYTTSGSIPITTTINYLGPQGENTTASSTATVASVASVISPISQLIVIPQLTAVSPTTILGSFKYILPASSSSFTASIAWGDGHVTEGGVTQEATPGVWDVTGTRPDGTITNTYQLPGTYPVNITVQDQLGNTSTISSKAIVLSQASSTFTGINFAFTPNAPITTDVATFTDSNPLATASNITAIISWNDGHVSNGVISGPNSAGLYAVTGTNTYPSGSSSYKVTISISDPSGLIGTATAVAIRTSSLVSLTPASFPITLGAPFSTTVATFTDSNPLATSANTTAVIDWGDGHTSAGTITGPDAKGVFTVTGAYTYTRQDLPPSGSSYTVTVKVTDPSGLTGTVTSTADESAAAINLTSVTFPITLGVPFSTTVATFTDSNPQATSSNTTALIDWGDGHSSVGTITGPDSKGVYTITGTYTYTRQNPPAAPMPGMPPSYNVNVKVTDPSSLIGSVTSTADESAAAINLTSVTFPITLGVPFSTTVATFTDSNPQATSSNTTAVIDWGDHHTSGGTITGPDSKGVYTITGAYTYTNQNPPSNGSSYPVTINVTDPSSLPGPVISTAVESRPSVNLTGTTIPVTLGIPFSTTVATYTVLNSQATATNTSAVISWGDGHTSAGTITGPDANGVYTVTGSYTYTSQSPPNPIFNNYMITVQVNGPGGMTGSVGSQAVVTSTMLQVNKMNFSATAGVSFTTTVATFTDSNPTALTTKPTVVINWGDSSTSAGVVTGPDSNGVFTVTGTHNYFNSNMPSTSPYQVSITVTDASGEHATAVAQGIVLPTPSFTSSISGSLSTGGLDSSTNRPIFVGKTTAYALVQLFAQPSGIDATLPLGQTIAGTDGGWSLLTGPLADGIYTVTAVVTPSGGSPSAPLPLNNAPLSPSNQYIIDTTPPAVVSASENFKLNQVYVYFRDDLSGMSLPTLTNVANYTLSGPGLAPFHPSSVTLLPSGGLPTDVQGVALAISTNVRVRRHLRNVRIAGTGIMDNAGNSLGKDFHGTLIASTGRASGNVVAKIGSHSSKSQRK